MRVARSRRFTNRGKIPLRNRLALGGAALPPGLPSAPLPPLRAEALHHRRADNRKQNLKCPS